MPLKRGLPLVPCMPCRRPSTGWASPPPWAPTSPSRCGGASAALARSASAARTASEQPKQQASSHTHPRLRTKTPARRLLCRPLRVCMRSGLNAWTPCQAEAPRSVAGALLTHECVLSLSAPQPPQSRNVLSKKLMVAKGSDTIDKTNLFGIMTILAFLMLLPVSIAVEGWRLSPAALDALVSAGSGWQQSARAQGEAERQRGSCTTQAAGGSAHSATEHACMHESGTRCCVHAPPAAAAGVFACCTRSSALPPCLACVQGITNHQQLVQRAVSAGLTFHLYQQVRRWCVGCGGGGG